MRAILEPDFRGFEWDEAKASSNIMKHGITFEEAAEALSHPHLERESHREGEARVLAICPMSSQIIAVVFVMRGDLCRIISARAARKDEQREYRQILA
jgi:uncharacterized DUF497 family protein